MTNGESDGERIPDPVARRDTPKGVVYTITLMTMTDTATATATGYQTYDTDDTLNGSLCPYSFRVSAVADPYT